jgi:2-keto-3-deoxy-L-rhamnonate aldolase RhmA
MTVGRVASSVAICILLCFSVPRLAHAQQDWRKAAGPVPIYNTAKKKLTEGKQIIGVSVSSPDPNIYCALASAGFDYTWIEMQHSPLTYEDVARMIWACRGTPAIPFIRVPDATESDIQKATDIGALGIIIPTVDTVAKAEAAVRWAKYPPLGRRSMGGGQYRDLWGNDYRQTANDNVLVVIMIETPTGVDNVEKIAAVPGVDMIYAASNDMANFSGYREGDPPYEALIARIHDATLKAGLKLGGPLAWRGRQGFTFFYGPGETALIKAGAQTMLGPSPAVKSLQK